MSEKKILFLDDRSKRIHSALAKFGSQVTIVCTVKECKKMILEHEWDEIYLDHDLSFEEFVSSDREDCGMEVVRWLTTAYVSYFAHVNGETLYHSQSGRLSVESHLLLHKKIIVHSSNLPSARFMAKKLRDSGFTAFAERWQYE